MQIENFVTPKRTTVPFELAVAGQTVTVNLDVVATTLDTGETVLMDMGTARYYTLNSTGTYIWTQLAGGESTTTILDTITATYDVTLEHATQSLYALLQELSEQALLTIDG